MFWWKNNRTEWNCYAAFSRGRGTRHSRTKIQHNRSVWPRSKLFRCYGNIWRIRTSAFVRIMMCWGRLWILQMTPGKWRIAHSGYWNFEVNVVPRAHINNQAVYPTSRFERAGAVTTELISGSAGVIVSLFERIRKKITNDHDRNSNWFCTFNSLTTLLKR